MSAFCSECKCCEAQASMADDPKPLCVFCEDGVPCPNRQRAARPVVTPSPSRLLAPPVTTARKPRNPNSPWRGMASLHLSDKAPEKPATTNGAAALQDKGQEPQQIDEVPTAGKDRQEEKERTVKPNPDDDNIPRYCSVDGCTAKLKANNKTGRCSKHWYVKKGDAPKSPRSKATPPRNSTARVETPANGVATLRVTESHLNDFILKLSLDEKTAIVQRHLEGA